MGNGTQDGFLAKGTKNTFFSGFAYRDGILNILPQSSGEFGPEGGPEEFQETFISIRTKIMVRNHMKK